MSPTGIPICRHPFIDNYQSINLIHSTFHLISFDQLTISFRISAFKSCLIILNFSKFMCVQVAIAPWCGRPTCKDFFFWPNSCQNTMKTLNSVILSYLTFPPLNLFPKKCSNWFPLSRLWLTYLIDFERIKKNRTMITNESHDSKSVPSFQGQRFFSITTFTIDILIKNENFAKPQCWMCESNWRFFVSLFFMFGTRALDNESNLYV